MGSSNSKNDKDEALRLCKHRRRFIKQAIDSRYALAASHVSYVHSLRDLGVALRRYAEAEVLIESSLSISDKTPSHSSYPSPSLSQLNEVVSDHSRMSHNNVVVTNLNLMRSGFGPVSSAVTVTLPPVVDEFPIPMPPPPPHFAGESGSWDFFDPVDDESDRSFRFVGTHGFDEGFSGTESGEPRSPNLGIDVSVERAVKNDEVDDSKIVEKEDPSEFITHRAKDFLSSIKDIEHRFFRASESGKEVSRMLEANKIRVGYSVAKEKSSALAFVQALQVVCCHRDGSVISNELSGQGTKVITWKRTTSSRSSSSRNALNGSSKDDGNDSGSDFVEEFCMIAGSHSSTLDRLYAWERKLCDEVKASESIRNEYDQKCAKLRNMFAKDYSSQTIDKTRAVVKDLHSRIRVAIHSVDSISKRIEKMRDEELHPQLVELTQGLIRMWKSMLECHHAQYITISLAYDSKNTATGTPRGVAHKQIMEQLLQEVECFGLSFADWINSLTSYVEALNSWLHNSILPPRERSKRRPFSPRRYLGPPIFTLCRDWTAEIRSLPSNELTSAIQAFLSDLQQMSEQQAELQKKAADTKSGTESEANKEEDVNSGNKGSNGNNGDPSLSCIQATLTKVLDRLTKFSESSLKMYEDLKQKNEAARVAYSNCRSRF